MVAQTPTRSRALTLATAPGVSRTPAGSFAATRTRTRTRVVRPLSCLEEEATAHGALVAPADFDQEETPVMSP